MNATTSLILLPRNRARSARTANTRLPRRPTSRTPSAGCPLALREYAPPLPLARHRRRRAPTSRCPRDRGTSSPAAASRTSRPRRASPRTPSTSPCSHASMYRSTSSRSAVVAERPQRRLLALLGHALVDRGPRALQRAVDRRQLVSSISAASLGRVAEHLAQDQRRALVGRQVLERGDERQLDALALLVAGLRRRRPPSGRAARRDRARSRATRRAARRAGCGLGGRAVVDRQHALAALARSGQAGVGGDRYSHVAASCGPRSAPSPRHARSSVSWSASSASWTEPSIR